jgi:capsular polysaccharide biosynthesis protein
MYLIPRISKPDVCENIYNWLCQNPSLGTIHKTFETKYPDYKQASIIGDKSHDFMEKTKKRTFKQRYLASIKQVKIYSNRGILQLPDGLFAQETVYLLKFLKEHPSYKRHKIGRTERLKGRYFCIPMIWYNSYYHWLCEILPRLQHLVEEAPEDLKFIIPNKLEDYQLETLHILDINPDRCIEMPPSQVIEVEELYYCPPGAFTGWHECNSTQWLASKLLRHYGIKQDIKGSRRLFISREKTPERRIVNRDDLYKKCLEPLGFEMFIPEDLPFEQQLSLYNQANVIVAAHGTGLANMIFTAPGATVVELFNQDIIRPYYWSLSQCMNHHYHAMIGQSVQNGRYSDIRVDHDLLQQFLESNLD